MEKNEIDGKPAKKLKTIAKKPDQIILNPTTVDDNNKLNERVVELAQRRKRASLMRRVQAKLHRRKQLSATKLHSQQQLSQRSSSIAKTMLRKRLAGSQGAAYAHLSPSNKIQVDKIVDKKAILIRSMAKRMIPRLRSADVKRLQAVRSGGSVHGIQSYLSNRQLNMGDDFDLDHLVGMFEQITEKDIIALEAKASQHNIPEEVLEMVFIRGLYEGDKDKAFNRVNSFIAIAKEEVWDEPNPKKKGSKMTPSEKSSAKARAKAAGRPYPNLVDNMAAMKEAKDPREYDYEGDMAKSQLRSIIANAQAVHDMLKDDTNMAEWVQSKITLSADYISTVRDYMMSETNEEVKPIEELKSTTLTSYIDKVATGPSRGKTQTGLLKSIKAIGGVTTALRKKAENNMKEDAPFDTVAHKKETDRLMTKHMNAHAETTRLIKAKASQEEINKAQERNNAIKDEIRAHKDKAPKGPAPKPGSAAHYYASKKPGEYTGD